MIKRLKVFSALLIIITFILCIGCTEPSNHETDKTPKEVELPNLTGLSRQNIAKELDKLNIKYSFKFASVVCNNQYDYDKFVKYENGLEVGSKIKTDEVIYIYTTPLHLNIDIKDKVKLTTDYKGKSFVDDGIGEVTLAKNVDGDTAYFYDHNSKTETGQIRVRFLGIDTPESTYTIDPWGKAASKFTANILNNARTIVLEAEGARKETYGRYLAWVWVDGNLLNLQIVAEAYSNSTISSSSKYFKAMVETSMLARSTGRRFYGEIDPNYNYTTKK